MTDYTAEEVIQAADQMRKYLPDVNPTYWIMGERVIGHGIMHKSMRSANSVAYELMGMGLVALAGEGCGLTLDWRDMSESRIHVITDCDATGYTGKTPLAAVVAAVEAVLPIKGPTDD